MATETKIVISAVDNTRAAIDSAKKGVESLSNTITAMPGFGGFGAAIAALASAGAIKTLVADTISWAAGMDDLAEKTGASVQNLSGLAKIAKESGVEMDLVEAGLVKLSKSLSGADDEAKGAGRALEFLGLKGADLRKMDTADALKLVSDRMAEYGSGSGKTALAMDIFGKSGAQLLPLLNDLAEKNSIAGKLTAEQASAAELLEKAWVRTSAEGSRFGKELVIDLIPTLASVIDFINETKIGIVQFGSSLAVVGNDIVTFGQIAAVGFGAGFTDEGQAKIKEIWAERGRFVEAANEEMKDRLLSYQSLRTKIDATLAGGDAPRPGASYVGRDPKDPKSPTKATKSSASPEDDMTWAAKAYAKSMESIASAETTADKSTRDLNQAQAALFELMTSPAWGKMPDAWKETVIAQTAASTEAIEIAARQKRINDMIAATPTEKLKESRQAMQELAEEFDAGRISADQFIEAAGTKLGTLPEIAKEAGGSLETVITNSFQDMADAMADFALSGKGNFGSMVDAMIRDLIRLEMQTQMTTAYKSAGGISGIAGLIGKVFGGSSTTQSAAEVAVAADVNSAGLGGFAKGGVFNSPSLHTYANQVHDTPKFFQQYAKGGIFAEAGPEAIMPLSRDASGRLGVKSDGGASPSININVTNQGAADGYEATATAKKNGSGLDINVLVAKAIRDDQRRNGPITQGFAATFGMTRNG